MAPLVRMAVIPAVVVAVLAAGILVVYPALFESPDNIPEQAALEGKRGTDIDVKSDEGSASSRSSPYVREFSLPEDTLPNGILVDRKGTIWTVGAKSHSLIAFDPETQNARSYAIPGESVGSQLMMAWAVAEDRDGSILFSGAAGAPLWRFDPEAEQFEPIRAPSGAPMQVKLDDSGRIWYTLMSSGMVGVIQKENQSYKAKEFEVGKESFPSGIFVQNNMIWVTKVTDGHVVQFQVSTTDGEVTNLTELERFPSQLTFVSPNDILVRDGSVWIAEHNTSFITRYDTATDQITRYPTALHPVHVVTLPYWLEPGGQQGVWFNEHRGNRIGFFNFSDSTLTEYEIPTRNPDAGDIANALTIHVDPADENRLWFTEFTEDKIGYVDRNVPVPFGLRASERVLSLDQGGSVRVDLEVIRNAGVPLFDDILSFSTSSSTTTSGVLVNATTVFSPEGVDLSKVGDVQNVTFELHDEGLDKGTHMLAISATDGAVVMTIYLELVVG